MCGMEGEETALAFIQVSNVVLKTPQRKFEEVESGSTTPPSKVSPQRSRTSMAAHVASNLASGNSVHNGDGL